MRPFTLHQPATAREAVDVLADHPDARVIAGGTDLLTLLRDGISTPAHLVDVVGIGLNGVEHHRDGTVRIGAATRNSVTDHRLTEEFPALVEAVASGASPQIRNLATFGGNLLQSTRCPYFRQLGFACNRRVPGSGCAAAHGDRRQAAIFGASPTCLAVHPSDLAVALSALDATVVVEGPDGTRKIPVDRLSRLPGTTPQRATTLRRTELITGIELTAGPRTRRSRHVKFRERASFAFAVASAAASVELVGGVVRSARIALGGVAPAPWRATAAEKVLVGHAFDSDAISAAAEAATAGAMPTDDNAHKVDLVRRVVRRALSDLGGRP